MAAIGSATFRLADIGPLAMTRLESRHVDSPRHVSAGASVPRDPPSRPSIPEPMPCACSSADAAEAKCRGRGSSRRVAQAPGWPKTCREKAKLLVEYAQLPAGKGSWKVGAGGHRRGHAPSTAGQLLLSAPPRCAVQELSLSVHPVGAESIYGSSHMPSCWPVSPYIRVYSEACELCVCSVPGFSEVLETFYTVTRDVH